MPKRGLIILVATWLVLFLPAFRAQTRITLDDLGGANRSFYAIRGDWSEIEKANPGNAQLAFFELQTQRYQRASQSYQPNPQYWRDLDALVARFPNDLNLRRARLMESMHNGKLVRMIYALDEDSDSSLIRNPPDSEQRAAIAATARAGEKQAPDDGFFPWVEAMALWNRDETPALQALERAAVTSDFNDGTLANARALLALREAQTPLQWDEKIALMSGILWPHYAIMRELAREVTWSGIEHYRRGDKAGAYRRWRAILRASGAFRRAQSHGPESTVIGLLVAEALEKLVWGDVAAELTPLAANKSPGVPDSRDSAAVARAKLRAFVALARRDGQNDLATFCLRENASFEAQKLSSAISDNFDKLGFDSPVTTASLQLPWVGRLVFWPSVAGGLGLLVCLVWRFRVGGARWFGASAAQIAFFGALWVGALALAWWGRISYQMRQFGGLTGDATEVSAASALFNFFDNSGAIWTSMIATLALSIAFCYWQSSRETSRLQQQILPPADAATSGAWLPKISALAWITVVISTIAWFALGRDIATARALWIVCSLLALGLSLWRVERGDENKTRSRLALVGVTCGLITLGLAAQLSTRSNDNASYAAMISFLFTLAILVYLAANSRGWRPLLPRALATALQTLGGVAAVCAAMFLLASLAALPVRARQNRIVDDYIARGEIDWMRSIKK